MTHPLTPREKVVFKQPCDHCQRMTSVDLTALASGSGGHAELARLADDLRKFEHHSVGSLKISMDEVRRIIAVCDAHAALLAEIAALRAEHTHLVEQKEGAEDALFNALSRATEAERKLAEADQVIREISETAQISRVRHLARTFLSKEAERG